MTVEKITKQQYYQLIGLRAVADKKNKELDDLRDAALEIIQETDYNEQPDTCGHVSDWIFGSRDLDEMLRILKVKVTK